MKIKFLTLLMALVIPLASLHAQEELFKVLASKGNIKVVSKNSPEHKPIVIGKKLLSTDKIIVGENSYLGLAHKTGKTIELKKAGTYEVSKLSGEVASQNAGVAEKYVAFVAGEMSSQDEDMAKNRHKYMAVTGSVERGEKESLKLLATKESYVLSAPVTIKWIPVEHAVSYIITFTDLAEEPVYTAETRENYIVIDLAKLNISTEKHFIYHVAVKEFSDKAKVKTQEVKSDTYIVKYVPDDKAPALEKQAAEIQTALSEETALNKFVLASFYEEQGLLLDARANYEAATKLEPGVDSYSAAYGKFLENYKLSSAGH